MPATIGRVFQVPARFHALYTLRAICQDQLEDAIDKLAATNSEIEQFKNPAFWEDWLKEDREFMDVVDEGKSGLQGVIDQAAQDGIAMQHWQELATEGLKETYLLAQDLADFLKLIRANDYDGVVAILKKSAEEYRAEAENCRKNGRDIPVLKTGQESMAQTFLFDAEFCELFIRVLSFHFKT